jgi:hypothetical protein
MFLRDQATLITVALVAASALMAVIEARKSGSDSLSGATNMAEDTRDNRHIRSIRVSQVLRWSRSLRVSSHSVLVIVLACAVVTASAVATHYARDDAQQRAITTSLQLADAVRDIDGNQPVLARQLAVVAWRITPTTPAHVAIMDLLKEQHDHGIVVGSAMVFSSDEEAMASAAGKVVQLWNLATWPPGNHVVSRPSSKEAPLGSNPCPPHCQWNDFVPHLHHSDPAGKTRLS